MTTPPHAQGQQTQSRFGIDSSASKASPPYHPMQTSPQRALQPAASDVGSRKAGLASGGIGNLAPSHSSEPVPPSGAALPLIHITDAAAESAAPYLLSSTSASSAVHVQTTCSTQPTTASALLATKGPITQPVSSVPMTTVAHPISSVPTAAVMQASSSMPMLTVAHPISSMSSTSMAHHVSSVPMATVTHVVSSPPTASALPQSQPSVCLPTTSAVAGPTVHLATGVPVAHQATNPPMLSLGAHPTIAQQQMEYQAAMELEMWKITQEQAFLQSLK